MKHRPLARTGAAGVSDVVTGVHALALLNTQDRVEAIGRDPAVFMADQHQLAIALQLIAGIDNLAGGRSA